MTPEPILTADLTIQIHAAPGVLSVAVGPLALFRQRRDRLHKLAGYTWVIAMGVLSISAFFISGFGVIGPFSPLHAFAVLTLWSLYEGMRHIFAGRVCSHKAVFQSLYWNGLLVAGLFNFLPGRTINRMLFPDAAEFGWAVIALGGGLVLWRHLRARRSLPTAVT